MRLQQLRTQSGEPAVTQHTLGKYVLSYNPDDSMYYVSVAHDTVAKFKDYRNATYYLKRKALQ